MSQKTIYSTIKFHLSVAEQIKLLKGRGMTMLDDASAAGIMQRIGYYRLSGYFYPLRKTHPRGTPGRQDDFQSGTSIELIANLYEFDRQLRLLVLDAVERVEVAIRFDISHRLGQRHRIAHEAESQLDTKFCTVRDPYSGKTGYEIWCERLAVVLKKARKEDFVKHHSENYGGKMPIWVVTEVWDFGLLSKFFAGMRYKDQLQIARRYGLPDAKYLISWLRAINFARNVSAHHSRLWNRNFADRPTFPPAQPHHNFHHLVSDNHAQTRIYGSLCILKTMLSAVAPNNDWTERLKILCKSFPGSTLISLKSAGFPEDWEDKAIWR
jgi:abortive infection bacteriophage resistance protein